MPSPVELPRFRGHLSAWGEMITREVSDAEQTLPNWVRHADVDEGSREGLTGSEPRW